MVHLQNLPTHDRPREKLTRRGAASLSDQDLLALLLGSGTKTCDVLSLAERILKVIDSKNGSLQPADLSAVPGVGPVKASQIIAALEFARRRIRPEGQKIKEPGEVVGLIAHLSTRKQEHFAAVSLNGAHEVMAVRTITVGLANASQVHPREVYADLLSERACAVIVAHNHPSGDLTPSKEDREVTKKLKAAGEILGILLLDHVIVSSRGYFSFKENGLL